MKCRFLFFVDVAYNSKSLCFVFDEKNYNINEIVCMFRCIFYSNFLTTVSNKKNIRFGFVLSFTKIFQCQYFILNTISITITICDLKSCSMWVVAVIMIDITTVAVAAA